MKKQTFTLNELQTKFDMVKSRNWILSQRKGPTGVGKTFEDLIEKKEDNLPIADYGVYEIKAHLGKTRITLFTKSPIKSDKSKGVNLEIRETFGVVSKTFPDVKTFFPTLSAKELTSTEGKYEYQFKLSVNREEKRIYFIAIKDNKVINNDYFWNFSDFSSLLENKLKKIAIVQADSRKVITTIDGISTTEIYYRYKKMRIFTGLNLEKFIKAIEDGSIIVEPRMGYYNSGKNKGKPHDYGTAFRIHSADLLKYGGFNDYE